MNSFPFDIIGFDLDGTLIDTSEDLRLACNHALALADIPPLSPAQIRPTIGGGARLMLQRGIALGAPSDVSPDLFDQMFDAFLKFYMANIAVHSKPFPGALDMLDDLDRMGVKVGLVTNKLEGHAIALFDALGLRDRFAAFLGRDSLGRETPKPAPDLIHAMLARSGTSRAAFVGDSDFDIGAARAADVPVVAVSFGFLQQPVDTLGADAIIDHFDELIPVLRTLTASPA